MSRCMGPGVRRTACFSEFYMYMGGWHHRLNGHETEQTLGDDELWGREAWCAAVHRVAESDMTE